MPETTHAAEFLEALTAAKEKIKKEETKVKKKKIKKKPGGLKKAPSKEKEAREKLEEISIEKETKPAKLKPLPSELVPPIYKRPLPRLPQAPRTTEEWPLRPPRPPERPPEEEAAAAPAAPTPTPFPPEIKPKLPVPRPVIIKPVPTAPAAPTAAPTFDLSKLNPLIEDETITTIQCDGANIPIKIIKERRVEELALVLSEEEIKSIIKAFSDASSQAVTEPMFKASAAGLTISATVSAFAGCKFVITRS